MGSLEDEAHRDQPHAKPKCDQMLPQKAYGQKKPKRKLSSKSWWLIDYLVGNGKEERMMSYEKTLKHDFTHHMTFLYHQEPQNLNWGVYIHVFWKANLGNTPLEIKMIGSQKPTGAEINKSRATMLISASLIKSITWEWPVSMWARSVGQFQVQLLLPHKPIRSTHQPSPYTMLLGSDQAVSP